MAEGFAPKRYEHRWYSLLLIVGLIVSTIGAIHLILLLLFLIFLMKMKNKEKVWNDKYDNAIQRCCIAAPSHNPLKYEIHISFWLHSRSEISFFKYCIQFGYQTVEKYDKDNKVTIAVGSTTCLYCYLLLWLLKFIVRWNCMLATIIVSLLLLLSRHRFIVVII